MVVIEYDYLFVYVFDQWQVVVGYQYGGVDLLEFGEQVYDFYCQLWVEVVGGFVGDQQVWLCYDGVGDVYVLLFVGG